MRQALAKTALICLICALLAIFVISETRTSPLIVETQKPSTTVVKTGDQFQQTYRVRFLDLSHRGKEIEILADEMQPDKLNFAPFEATRLEITKNKNGKEYDWDFTYTLRVINKEKGEYAIPKIKFLWVVKTLGGNEKETKVREFETEGVRIKYVSTITKEPHLDIRDETDLGTFWPYAYAFWALSVLVALLFLGYLWRELRKSSAEKTPAEQAQTRRQAYRKIERLIAEIETLGKNEPTEDSMALCVLKFMELERKLLMLELPEECNAWTAQEILGHVDKLKSGRRKATLAQLAERYAFYEKAAISGKIPRVDAGADLKNAKAIFRKLKFWGWLKWIA
ncbi:MAG: hypothetical protein AAB897_03510 [Patescibacteria group bacterium]